ncbi:ABC transporter ATP-binding protein [Candidatus Harpocratesius sp.]
MSNKQNEAIIKISQLSKIYKLGEFQVKALDQVSFEIPPEQVVFIMGPSGSGKTTLLNLIGGIDSATNGSIIVCGEEISEFSSAKLTKYRKKRLSFVFQFYSLIPTLTARENVELTMELMKKYSINGGKKRLHEEAEQYLEMVELKDRIHNFPSQLSGGERQRVAIARALAKNPDILLVDEPTGQLDQKTGEKIVSLIQRIAKERRITVILVTHDPTMVKYADRIIELRSGAIVSDSINYEKIEAIN